MGDKSKIEWTDATWNTVYGCTHVSEGCRNCYAERLAPKMGKDFSKITLAPERLDLPLRWKRPRRIFVNSLSDLFHEEVPEDFIDKVFAVMALSPQHTFQILTKRPERMLAWFGSIGGTMRRDWVASALCRIKDTHTIPPFTWPLPNVWLGVSVENQATADERIPVLLQTPAAVRWISAEPLLGPLDLKVWFMKLRTEWPGVKLTGGVSFDIADKVLDWVVVGGESGPGARPMHPDWARSIRDQCQSAGVPFFFKQWGEWGAEIVPPVHDSFRWPIYPDEPAGGVWSYRTGKKRAGRLLDGREWSEFPS